MGARSTGLAPRRGYTLDAATVLVGAVAAGTRGRTAETRTGAARLLNTRLEAQDVFKIVVHGQTSDSAGGYVIQAAHVAEGAALASASTYATIAAVTITPGINEVALSGAQVRELVRVAGSVTGDVRVAAIRAIAGTGSLAITNVALTSNVATVTIGANSIQVGDTVTVACSDTVFNGTYVVTARTSTTISYARTNANVSSGAATGTVTNGLAVPAGTNTVSVQTAYC